MLSDKDNFSNKFT